jgi:D-alanine-D-alanine ligase
MAGYSASAVPAALDRKKVLHLMGSREESFYHDLSVLYARACDDCKDLDRKRYEFHYAIVHMDGLWSFPSDISEQAVEKAPHMATAAAIAHIAQMDPDVMVPHMFCVEGMTRFRALFDLLQIPFLGNHDYTVWLSTDKAITKNMLAPAGVQVPRGDVLVKGETERPTTVKVPFIVKPCNEDNSRGIKLVRSEEDAAAAIEYAFGFDTKLVVEEYIAGREVRAACIEEEDGSLTVLPKIEYFLEDIRTSGHKLSTDKSGKLSANAIKAAKKDGDRQCPADLSPVLHARIDEMVIKAHKALKCHHYSLYDIRIDENEQPYFLEAALFCSFSPVSVIPAMAAHAGREDLKHPNMFHSFLERAIAEKHAQQAVTCEAVNWQRKTCPQTGHADNIATAPTTDSLPEVDGIASTDDESPLVIS